MPFFPDLFEMLASPSTPGIDALVRLGGLRAADDITLFGMLLSPLNEPERPSRIEATCRLPQDVLDRLAFFIDDARDLVALANSSPPALEAAITWLRCTHLILDEVETECRCSACACGLSRRQGIALCCPRAADKAGNNYDLYQGVFEGEHANQVVHISVGADLEDDHGTNIIACGSISWPLIIRHRSDTGRKWRVYVNVFRTTQRGPVEMEESESVMSEET